MPPKPSSKKECNATKDTTILWQNKDPELLEKRKRETCVYCGRWPPNVPAYIKNKGSGGPVEDWNLMPLCVRHRRYQADVGWWRLADESWAITEWLRENGWSFVGRKLFHPSCESPVD